MGLDDDEMGSIVSVCLETMPDDETFVMGAAVFSKEELLAHVANGSSVGNRISKMIVDSQLSVSKPEIKPRS